jgi:transforming growth factor-beta-induced protein
MDERTGAPAGHRADHPPGPGDEPRAAAWLWLMPVLLLLAIGAIALTGGDDGAAANSATPTAPAPAPRLGPSAFAVINGQGDLSTLSALLRRTGLADVLGEDGPFTVFAPDDAAFAALPPGAVDALRGDPALAKRVLAHHVVNGQAGAADLRPGGRGLLTPIDGTTLAVTVAGGRVGVGAATIVEPDQEAANGVVHVVDAVVLPQGVTFPEPPAPKPAVEAAPPAPPAPAAGNVLDVVRAGGRFTQLAALIDAAGRAGELAGPGPFTLFAPTDEAFARVPKATLDAVAADPRAAARLVGAQVSPGRVTAADLTAGPHPTLADQSLTVRFEAGKVRLSAGDGDGATLVDPDLPATNGVVHVVDRVLLPTDLPGS